MLNLRQTSHLATLTVLLGALALTPAFAVNPATETPADMQTTDTQTNTQMMTGTKATGHHQKHETAEEMKEHVENRIATLHTKLMITQDQESDWANVAQAMRDSETATIQLIHERHSAPQPLTAVQDLESYQKITQAHADGLAKVVSAFGTLYNKMPDEQKANADKVFGGFEGHMGMHKHHAHK